jgi:hypothetical protein
MADCGQDTPVSVAKLSSSRLRISVLRPTAAVAVAAADVGMAAATFRC